MQTEPYEIFAIRYAHLGNRRPAENFILADPHEFASDLDYFVWVVRRSDRLFLIDTGFGKEAADRRKREWLRCPIESLRLVGIEPAERHQRNPHPSPLRPRRKSRPSPARPISSPG